MERVQTGLRVPCDLNQILKQEAEKLGTTKNALILEILRNWTRQQKNSSLVRPIPSGQGEARPSA